MPSTSGGLSRWTLSGGVGVPAGSRTRSVSGSWPWPVLAPTRWGPADALVAATAVGLSAGARSDLHLAVASGADPARRRAVVSANAHVEGVARPRLRPQGRARDR